MDQGWDFSEMEVESTSTNFTENQSNTELNNFVKRNHKTQSTLKSTNPDNPLNRSIAQSVKLRKRINKSKNRYRQFREVPLEDIIVGCNNRGTPDSRYIVPEENNSNYVKEYTKTRERFYCVGCGTKQKKTEGKIVGNIFYAPEYHLENCIPILRIRAESRLKITKDKASKKNGHTISMKAKENRVSSNMQQQESEELIKTEPDDESQVEIITIDDDDDDDEFISDQTFKEECIITKPEIGDLEMTILNTPKIEPEVPQIPKQDEKTCSILERIKLQNEYLANLAKVNKSKRNHSTVTSNHNNNIVTSPFPNAKTLYEFNHPSTQWLKKACNKLKLIFHQNVYQFWANIDITHITETSKPIQIYKMSEGKFSGFRALSFMISGYETSKVKNVIYKYFLENYKTLGFFGGINFSTLTSDSEIIKQTIFGEYLTPELWEMTANMLECRIGIFIKDKIVKYGNWSNSDKNDEDDEIITFLFQIYGENYCIVESVINK